MTADGWTKAVRQQLGLGRVLPLGGPHDGTWITESAAVAALRRTAAALRGLSLDRLRIEPADSGAKEGKEGKEGAHGYDHDTAVPPPPSALPPGPLRITADLAAMAGPAPEPLPATAARLRTALFTAAGERLGLTVAEVDLRVTRLLEADAGPSGPAPAPPSSAAAPTAPAGDDEESRVAAAALSVPGVARLTGALEGLGGPGGLGRPVDIAAGPALPRRHVRVELAVTEERRALDVAREVRGAVTVCLPDHPSVAVLITAIGT
ncbi:nucleopolyhedrovirus P10 family protein [Streptomyces caniscabiei]|uniref:Nucleopolyhedrovirus P10 family protein n=1 Tax=Streptomyces caniscabiei TaxID=2746961 RepID=A0A927LC38_9ACTN|nr:nucleopolyhedrovirus P10 family protein [Streptomyces caniscabiei]MBD9704363.1 nucleopolyhedrovirus P10 family protein [Streptomyces caniscabiei]MBD9729622.1 nucleopolyhedrovirus P10 family protein [Streptomyces caniscabiei]MDX3515377.1 nucleopolyhedrovirus P10 family protein [Streptomyces caniscabiei]MDX3724278.1 nucleopolyhedrovirus P10 family protein [Streptomyces caniscabiei]MDX3732739.1 nucleopolyhedrovirus P10 family protein [Streptomyces caniscabiei]